MEKGERYIHIKSMNPYTLITDNFMFKDNGEWRRGLCLYKTEYNNPDGEYFARTREDFEKNFCKKVIVNMNLLLMRLQRLMKCLVTNVAMIMCFTLTTMATYLYLRIRVHGYVLPGVNG